MRGIVSLSLDTLSETGAELSAVDDVGGRPWPLARIHRKKPGRGRDSGAVDRIYLPYEVDPDAAVHALRPRV